MIFPSLQMTHLAFRTWSMRFSSSLHVNVVEKGICATSEKAFQTACCNKGEFDVADTSTQCLEHHHGLLRAAQGPLTYNLNNHWNYSWGAFVTIVLFLILVSLQDLIDEWKAKEVKRGNSNKTIDPTSLKWTPPKGTWAPPTSGYWLNFILTSHK